MMHAFTNTDWASTEWAIDDAVVRLREWGTDRVHPLPQLPIRECMVGAVSTCAICLDDPTQMVSRLHARLVRDRDTWMLVDMGSKNGLRVDGARRSDIVLAPGLEIGIGGITLIAESPLSIDLRGYLARLLGWGIERVRVVDHALRSVRLAAAHRVALVLGGEGDLVPTALSLHRRTRGADRPFIVCDPRRVGGKANVRSAENHGAGEDAVAAAAGGSLCVRAQRLPPDFDRLVAALRHPDSQVQLIICGADDQARVKNNATPIVIPPLADRVSEIDRIIDEYASDATAELGLVRSSFPAMDHAWVREHACSSLPDIEKATLRLVALRNSRSLSKAASRLGMAPVSLMRWIGRRRLPLKVVE